jgi:hypothetical protein
MTSITATAPIYCATFPTGDGHEPPPSPMTPPTPRGRGRARAP